MWESYYVELEAMCDAYYEEIERVIKRMLPIIHKEFTKIHSDHSDEQFGYFMDEFMEHLWDWSKIYQKQQELEKAKNLKDYIMEMK